MRTLGVGQSLVLRERYLALAADDVRVWKVFIQRKIIPFERVWYNIRVGFGRYRGEDQVLKQLDRRLSTKRIDVVGLYNGVYYVIELKGLAEGYSIGQVLMYWDHFRREFVEGTNSAPMVIGGVLDQDFEQTAAARGVWLVELGDDWWHDAAGFAPTFFSHEKK